MFELLYVYSVLFRRRVVAGRGAQAGGVAEDGGGGRQTEPGAGRTNASSFDRPGTLQG